MQKSAPKGPKRPIKKVPLPPKGRPGMPKKIPGMPPVKTPKGGFWGNMFSIVLIFITLMLLYSLVTERNSEVKEVAISEVAQDEDLILPLDSCLQGDNKSCLDPF